LLQRISILPQSSSRRGFLLLFANFLYGAEKEVSKMNWLLRNLKYWLPYTIVLVVWLSAPLLPSSATFHSYIPDLYKFLKCALGATNGLLAVFILCIYGGDWLDNFNDGFFSFLGVAAYGIVSWVACLIAPPLVIIAILNLEFWLAHRHFKQNP